MEQVLQGCREVEVVEDLVSEQDEDDDRGIDPKSSRKRPFAHSSAEMAPQKAAFPRSKLIPKQESESSILRRELTITDNKLAGTVTCMCNHCLLH